MTAQPKPEPRELVDGPLRRDLVKRLKAAMSAQTVLESLHSEWAYPRASGREVSSCRLLRVYPRREAFLLEYEVGLQGEEADRRRLLFGEIVAEDPEVRLAEVESRLGKRLVGHVEAGLLDCLPSLGMIVRFSGLDERLPGLRLLEKPRAVQALLLEHLLPGVDRLDRFDAEILGHRLGTRCTVRLRFRTEDRRSSRPRQHSAVAKMYKRRYGRGAQVAQSMALLRRAGFDDASQVRVPRPHVYLDDWEMLLMEDTEGTPLAQLEGADYTRGAAAAGRSLARLHHCEIRVPRSHSVDDELVLLERWVRLVGEVHVELATATARALQRVREALAPHRDAPTTLAHRDYYDKQVLIDATRTAVIDLDTLCTSDPAIDVGNFLAHLRLRRAQGRDVWEDADGEFLSSYDPPVDRGFDARLAAYTDATLLRLACLYAFRAPWRHVSERLVAQIR